MDIKGEIGEKRFKTMIKILNWMIEFARKKKIEVAVIYIPAPFQYDPEAMFRTINNARKFGMECNSYWYNKKSKTQKRIEEWAQRANVKYFDLTPFLKEEAANGAHLMFKIDGRWNPLGHLVAAKVL